VLALTINTSNLGTVPNLPPFAESGLRTKLQKNSGFKITEGFSNMFKSSKSKNLVGVLSLLLLVTLVPSANSAAALAKCNLSAGPAVNGSINWTIGILSNDYSNPATANNGQNVKFKLNPDDGFELNSASVQDNVRAVSANLENPSNGNTFYVFKCDSINHRITASFTEKTFQVDILSTAVSEEDDDFTDTCTKPRVRDVLSATGKKTYNFQACDNYEITNVWVNLSPMGALQSYEVKNPRRDYSIIVASRPIRYSVSITIGNNGLVVGPRGRIYNPGSYTKNIRANRVISFTSQPLSNYHASSALLGSTEELFDSYTTDDRETTIDRQGSFSINGSTTLSFAFFINNYKIDTTTLEGDSYSGSIDPIDTNGLVNDRGLNRWALGSNATFNVIPTNGNQITSVKVDNDVFQGSTLKNSHTFSNIQSSHRISATSEAIQGNRQSTNGSCNSNSSAATLNSQGKGVTQNANAFCVATPGQNK